ncbi:nucleotidyltransferase family protein [Poseidonocella sedimentorum]|uniref:Molybdenum cofactor cytidylyltransferase n=1 Tax=Poseidonocella sedimentorum TaxID=871652 RepID=A0A1I6DSQ3_9RHOB|nr:nucleotidyltransferase family protein [Poseidonocella sedimentorum]SFR08474.1 molybdenum cofactor cytidylyltransferase [Poseidonocella sedimentorum]
MTSVRAILPAAGLSRRMGAANKLLLPIDGRPMIRHMAALYTEATGAPPLVVTGHEAEAVEAALAGSGAICLRNPDYARGQAGSVACGLGAAPEAAAYLIALGDQPLLRAADIRALLDAHWAGGNRRISIPCKGAARGNPVVVPRAFRARLLADPRNPGCGRFTRENAEHVARIACDAPGFYHDIDTPEAYRALFGPERGARTRRLLRAITALRRCVALTPQQADALASMKFPCC